MKLQNPSTAYNQVREIERNRALEHADRENHKRNRDIEVGGSSLILKSPDGNRWALTVSDAGVVGATAL